MGKEIKKRDTAITVNVLVKKEDDIFVAHCLELDIVTTAASSEQVEKDMVSLINAQVSCAFANNNLDNLFHPAPQEVWNKFFACKERIEKKHKVKAVKETRVSRSITPPWIITNTCLFPGVCHA